MRIGYDGKRAVQNFTGLGNYSRYVVQSLSAFAPENYKIDNRKLNEAILSLNRFYK